MPSIDLTYPNNALSDEAQERLTNLVVRRVTL